MAAVKVDASGAGSEAVTGAALVAEPAAASGSASRVEASGSASRVEASAWASAACWALASETLLAVELDLESSGARSASPSASASGGK